MKNRRGLTLIELVIVLGLAGLILSLIFLPVMFSYRSFNAQNEKANLVQKTRSTMNYLTRQIRMSNFVEVSENSLIIDNTVYELKNRILYRNGMKFVEGVDEFNISMDNKTLDIEIVINEKNGKKYNLSSTVNIR